MSMNYFNFKEQYYPFYGLFTKSLHVAAFRFVFSLNERVFPAYMLSKNM